MILSIENQIPKYPSYRNRMSQICVVELINQEQCHCSKISANYTTHSNTIRTKDNESISKIWLCKHLEKVLTQHYLKSILIRYFPCFICESNAVPKSIQSSGLYPRITYIVGPLIRLNKLHPYRVINGNCNFQISPTMLSKTSRKRM